MFLLRLSTDSAVQLTKIYFIRVFRKISTAWNEVPQIWSIISHDEEPRTFWYHPWAHWFIPPFLPTTCRFTDSQKHGHTTQYPLRPMKFSHSVLYQLRPSSCFKCPYFFKMAHIWETSLPRDANGWRQSIFIPDFTSFLFQSNWLAKKVVHIKGKAEKKNCSNNTIPFFHILLCHFQQTMRRHHDLRKKWVIV